MLKTAAYAATSATTPLAPFSIDRREPGDHDVLIEILYCGICHSDIHQARGEWGNSRFPMVPGHEIVGRVAKVGAHVTRWKVGDNVGVGVFIDSCKTCHECTSGEEHFCEQGITQTYNDVERGSQNLTFGGYSKQITVDERYVLKIPDGMDLAAAAPLLCAGITTYSPLKHFGCKPGAAVAVLGLGGLGHVGVKFAKALGAHVTVLSTSESKRAAAIKLGADDFVVTKDASAFSANAKRFDLILDTASGNHDYNAFLGMLKRDGVMVLVGIPDPQPVFAVSLIAGRKSLAGSMIGSMAETQEMLDFAALHGFAADVELINIQQVNEAYERVVKADVLYRFVIDMSSLPPA